MPQPLNAVFRVVHHRHGKPPAGGVSFRVHEARDYPHHVKRNLPNAIKVLLNKPPKSFVTLYTAHNYIIRLYRLNDAPPEQWDGEGNPVKQWSRVDRGCFDEQKQQEVYRG